MALEWFEPDLLGMDDPNACPLWMTSWHEFIIELQTTFSPHNPVANAEHQLNHLHMKVTHHVNRYVVDFNQIVSQVRGYSDGTLRHHFYSGLPDRIKDKISHISKPRTLDNLHAVTQEIDTQYWERKEEIACQNKTLTSTSTNTNTTSKSSGKSEKSKSSLGNSAQSLSSLNLTPKKSGKTPKLLDKLSKDGKLTSEEHKHRFEQNLCMFCGSSGYKVKKCPKSGSWAAKGRSVTTTVTTMSEAKPMASIEAKIDSNSRDSAQSGSCIVPDCAPMEAQLNAATLSNPNSLQPSVTIIVHAIPSFPMLVDSCSTHCFVDLLFANIVKSGSSPGQSPDDFQIKGMRMEGQRLA